MPLVIRTTGLEDYLDGGETRIKALIMGPPSGGKTRSASFWPKPIFADCEEGRMSIADRAVPYGAIKSGQDMMDLLRQVELDCKKPKAERQWETFVLDTFDSLQRIYIQERLVETGREGLSGWQDWGWLDAKMQLVLSKLLALPMNIVVNLHVKETKVGEGEDGSGGYLAAFPKLKGDIRDSIPGDFDLIGYMGTYYDTENGERVLKRGIQWHPDPTKPVLKDRSGQLPKWTPVNFTAEDYSRLLVPLMEAADRLKAGSVVMEVPTEEKPKPAAAGRAGAMSAPGVKGAHAAAAPAATPPAPTSVGSPPAAAAEPARPAPTTPIKAASPPPPAARPVIGASPAPQAVAPAPAPAEPESAAPATHDEAVQTVQETLGGEVISESSPAEEAPATEAETPAPAPVEPASTEPPSQVTDGMRVVVCGTRDDDEPPTISGCGAELKITFDNGNITAVEGTESKDLVHIALLKTRHWLCNADFAKHRAATK